MPILRACSGFVPFMLVAALLLIGCGDSESDAQSRPDQATSSNETSAGTTATTDGVDTKGEQASRGDGKGVDAKEGAKDAAASGLASHADLGDELNTRVRAALRKARHGLVRVQKENGAFGAPSLSLPPNVGFTAMVTMGIMAATAKTQVSKDEAINKALSYIASNQKENGAIFSNPQHITYETSVAVGTFALARIAKFREAQNKAKKYLVESQIVGDKNDPSFGGFPYKQHKGQPADLSNAQIAATAVYDAGLDKDHALWKRLREFTKRVQNDSESNTTEQEIEFENKKIVVVSGQDGGGIYGPGLVKAGVVKRSDGKWEIRSYGSMGYALLKCLLFSGVKPEDRRVQILVTWLCDNWTVDKNPGFEAHEKPEEAGLQGLYYYYYTCARALAEYEKHTGKPLIIQDLTGTTHHWRRELAEKILSLQQENGLWKNTVDRWGESAETLASGYAMQTLGFITGRLP